MSDLLIGTSKSDVINGSDSSEVIDAGAGNDVVTAGAGDDTINGGDGNDRLDGGDGNDTLHGDNGNDRLYGGNGDDWLVGESGNDWAWGGCGNDALYGSDGNDSMFGDEGDDILVGGIGNDRLDGGADNDILRGDLGDDLLFASEGNDDLHGGEGNDTVSYANINGSVIVFLGDTVDTRASLKGSDGTKDLGSATLGTDYLTDIENVIGSSFDDAIFGNSSVNRLEGADGNDLLVAIGEDTLVGGNGSDTFAFFSLDPLNADEKAWVQDFNAAESDKIDLSRLGITITDEFLQRVTIEESQGQSIVTANVEGMNFMVGIRTIYITHTSADHLPLQISDFVLD